MQWSPTVISSINYQIQIKHENKNTQNIIITTLASPSKEFFIWPHEASLKN